MVIDWHLKYVEGSATLQIDRYASQTIKKRYCVSRPLSSFAISLYNDGGHNSSYYIASTSYVVALLHTPCSCQRLFEYNPISLHSANCSQHLIKLSTLIQLDDAALRTVIATSNEVRTDPDCWNGRPADNASHLGTECFAILHLIYFDDRVLGILCVKDRFRFDAEGSPDK